MPTTTETNRQRLIRCLTWDWKTTGTPLIWTLEQLAEAADMPIAEINPFAITEEQAAKLLAAYFGENIADPCGSAQGGTQDGIQRSETGRMCNQAV